jgi:hypothetical protein
MAEKQYFQFGLPAVWGYEDLEISGVGCQTTLSIDGPPPRRAFNIGFEGANPGPSFEEPKPRIRVKAGSQKI